jgi:hypothetical protein
MDFTWIEQIETTWIGTTGFSLIGKATLPSIVDSNSVCLMHMLGKSMMEQSGTEKLNTG